MDEILQRILAIEKEAAVIVADAEKEAERIMETARVDGERLRSELDEETVSQARRRVEEAVSAAEKERAEKLEMATGVIDDQRQAFETFITKRKDDIRNCLADPGFRLQ